MPLGALALLSVFTISLQVVAQIKDVGQVILYPVAHSGLDGLFVAVLCVAGTDLALLLGIALVRQLQRILGARAFHAFVYGVFDLEIYLSQLAMSEIDNYLQARLPQLIVQVELVLEWEQIDANRVAAAWLVVNQNLELVEAGPIIADGYLLRERAINDGLLDVGSPGQVPRVRAVDVQEISYSFWH